MLPHNIGLACAAAETGGDEGAEGLLDEAALEGGADNGRAVRANEEGIRLVSASVEAAPRQKINTILSFYHPPLSNAHPNTRRCAISARPHGTAKTLFTAPFTPSFICTGFVFETRQDKSAQCVNVCADTSGGVWRMRAYTASALFAACTFPSHCPAVIMIPLRYASSEKLPRPKSLPRASTGCSRRASPCHRYPFIPVKSKLYT